MGKADGSIDIWDLTDRSHEASLTVNVSSVAISSIEFWTSKSTSCRTWTRLTRPDGHQQLLACGDDLGTLHILEMPRSFRNKGANETNIIKLVFEREVQRVKYIASRMAFRKTEMVQKKAEEDRVLFQVQPLTVLDSP